MEWIQKVASVLLNAVSDPFRDSKVWDDAGDSGSADSGGNGPTFKYLAGLEQKPLGLVLMFLEPRMKARAMIASKHVYHEVRALASTASHRVQSGPCSSGTAAQASDGMFELDLFRQNDMGYDQIRSFIGRSQSRRCDVEMRRPKWRMIVVLRVHQVERNITESGRLARDCGRPFPVYLEEKNPF